MGNIYHMVFVLLLSTLGFNLHFIVLTVLTLDLVRSKCHGRTFGFCMYIYLGGARAQLWSLEVLKWNENNENVTFNSVFQFNPKIS